MDVSLPAAGLPTQAPSSATAPNKPAAASPQASSGEHSLLWKGEDFSFDDVLDVINPLQHIPIVGTIYRAVTGDKPGHLSQLLGDTLFGGIAGAASSVVNIAVEEITGKDLGEQALAMVGLDGEPSTQYASASGQPIPHPPSMLQGYTRSLGDPEDRRGGMDDSDGGIMVLTAQMRARIPAAEQPGSTDPQLASAAVPGQLAPGSTAQPTVATTQAPASAAQAAAGQPAAANAAASALPAQAGAANGQGATADARSLTQAAPSASPVASGPVATAPAPTALAQSLSQANTAVAAGLLGKDGAGQGPAVAQTPFASVANGSRLKPPSANQGGLVRSLSGQMLSNHAIPLSIPTTLTQGVANPGPRRLVPNGAAEGAPAQATTTPSAGFQATAAASAATPSSLPPIDVSQRMLDALERYNQMDAARRRAQAASAGTPPVPGV